jgi:hypothetical protein
MWGAERVRRIYGERGLAENEGAVWLYGENLTVHFADEPLAQYKVAYAKAGKRLRTVSDPRLFETAFQSPQLFLWEHGLADWHLVLRLPEYAPRRQLGTRVVQPPLFERGGDSTATP